MNIDQQIADVRALLDEVTDCNAVSARLDIRIMAIRALRLVDKRIHFKARSAGQKNRWQKVKSQEAV